MTPQYIEQKISSLKEDIRLYSQNGLVWLTGVAVKELRRFEALRDKHNGEHRSVSNGATQAV